MTSTWITRGIAAIVALSGLLFAIALERGSVERANRLHRDGDFAQAAVIYGQAVSDDPVGANRYNRGTTLLGMGAGDAANELAIASGDEDVDVSARANYNAGLISLQRALEAETADSMRAYAAAAVEANRQAIRLRADHPNSKWNLAIAQRMLDSLEADEQEEGTRGSEGAQESEIVARSENTTDIDGEEEVEEQAPRDGEDEAMAEFVDEPPLTLAEAEEILGQTHLDATLIMQKLMALESRGLFGRRVRRAAAPRR